MELAIWQTGRPPIADELDYLARPGDAYAEEFFSPYAEIEYAAAMHTMEEELRLERAGLGEKVSDTYFQDTMERETAFALKVLRGITEIAEHDLAPDQKITLMLDVDETSGVHTDHGTIARPALTPVISALRAKYGSRFEVGVLSTRPQDHLQNEATYFDGIKQVINPDLVFSSHDSELAQTLDPDLIADVRQDRHADLDKDGQLSLEEKRLQAIGSIISFEAVALPTEKLRYIYHQKLAMLQHLGQTHPDRVFVLLDDLPAASIVDPNHSSVRAIHVDASTKCHLADDPLLYYTPPAQPAGTKKEPPYRQLSILDLDNE